jgi:hypothetical protein
MNQHDILTMRINWEIQRIQGLEEYPELKFRHLSVRKLKVMYEELKNTK